MRKQFEEFLNKNLRSNILQINEMLSYVFREDKAKRLRSSIFLSLIKDLEFKVSKKKDDDLLWIACAIELLHESSLVHDDLPALDNDTLRRGKPTVHVKFGEGNAVLLGDWLLNEAYNLIIQSGFDTNVRLELIKKFTLRNKQLLEGQVMDLNTDSNPIEVARLKTGSLFALVFECAAVITSIPNNLATLMGEVGESLGILYQIFDDLKDQEQDKTKKVVSNTTLKVNTDHLDQFISSIKDEISNSLKQIEESLGAKLTETHSILYGLVGFKVI